MCQRTWEYTSSWILQSWLLCAYEVVYLVRVLTLRPYAPLILLLRCQSNFLAIRMECAELWSRCVCVLQAASYSALADRVCGGYGSPNVCIDPSFLPPMFVNRWSDGRQATGAEKEWNGTRERVLRGLQNRRKNTQSCIMSCRHDRCVAQGRLRKCEHRMQKRFVAKTWGNLHFCIQIHLFL